MDTALSTSPTRPASPSWKLYRRITDLPLLKFIVCLCDDDLSALIITGSPPEGEQQQAWSAIYDEWTDRMQTDEYEEVVDLTKDINLLETKFNTIQTIVKVLAFFPVPSLIDELSPELDKLLGFPIPLDPTDKVSYANALEGALGHGKRYWSEAQAMKTQLPAPDPQGVVHVTREYFDQVIVALSQYNKFKISKHDTTVGEFTALVQDMRRGMAAARKIQNN